MALPDRLSELSTDQDWLSWAAGAETHPSSSPPRRAAKPARRPATATGTGAARSRGSQEARRRMRLIRRRRLDLLQDGALALVLAIFVLVQSAGLGVVALLAALTTLALVASLVIEKRRRRLSAGRRPASAARPRR